MAHVYTEESNFENIANAIREKNGTDEQYLPSEMADAIRNIEPNLEEKRVTIDNNGETIIVPAEEYEGLSKVVVNSRVSGDGYDFTTIGYTKEESDEINSLNTNGIKEAKEIIDNWDKYLSRLDYKYSRSKTIVFFPNVDMSNVTSIYMMFSTSSIEYFNCDIFGEKSINGAWAFYYCGALKRAYMRGAKFSNCERMFCACFTLLDVEVDTSLSTSLYMAFYQCFILKEIFLDTSNTLDMGAMFAQCGSLNNVTLNNIDKCTSFLNTFSDCTALINVKLTKWKQANISFSRSTALSSESIHYIIQDAVDLADGATARTLTLHATAKTNWQNSEYYAEDLAVLEQKGITIA